MISTLQDLLGRVGAEYADLRYEVKHETAISFAGPDLILAGSNSADGYVLRVLDRGGFSTVTFTRESDAEEAMRAAVLNARLMGENRDPPIELAPAEVVKDRFTPDLGEDPRDLGLEEKVAHIRALNSIPLAAEKIATTTLRYSEVVRERHFASTEGAEVQEDLVTLNLNGSIVARDGNVTQDVRVEAGGSDGFQNLRNVEHRFEAKTKLAIDLLDAEGAAGGTYDCVLNPFLAGVFAHEAFGHFSEADIVERYPAMREKMALGARLGSEALSIVDDATTPGLIGFYRYDDEGVPVRRTPLMENGVLCGRLHSRRTAALFGEPISGHAVAEDYRFDPIVRMGTIYIEPGEPSFDELVERLGDGLYVVDCKGGQTSGESFSFGAQSAYEVKGGKVGRLLRDLNISGNLYRTMMDIEATGNDPWRCDTGGCGKGQLNPRSCLGGPHVLVRSLLVGGE